MNFWRRLLRDEEGPTAVEYAVMLGLIIGACFASIHLVGSPTRESFESSRDKISNAFTNAGVQNGGS
jgi:pilus assembly protein Flp/PilA